MSISRTDGQNMKFLFYALHIMKVLWIITTNRTIKKFGQRNLRYITITLTNRLYFCYHIVISTKNLYDNIGIK